MNRNHFLINKIKNIKYNAYEHNSLEDWNKTLKDNNELTCIHINIRSLRSNWETLLANIKPYLHKIDIVVLTEVNVNEVEASVYNIQNFLKVVKCRKHRRGGGIILFYKDTFYAEQINYSFEESENINIKIKNIKNKRVYIILAIYRPPNNDIKNFIMETDWWLRNATKKTDSVIMIGDMNICVKKKNATNTLYLNTLYGNEFLPTINKITREEYLNDKLTSSCLDHINIKLKYKYDISSSVIHEKLADHYFVALQIYQDVQANEEKKRENNKTTVVEILHTKKINKEINEYKWEDLQEIEDTDKLYEKIVEIFQNIYEKCSSVKNKTRKDEISPWVDKEIIKQIKEKNNMYLKWKNNKNNKILYEEYKIKRNTVTNLIKKSKRIYIYKMIKNSQGDMRKLWNAVNYTMERNSRKPNEEILTNNFHTTDLKTLSDKFNKTFKKQIKNLKRKNEGPQLEMNIKTFISQNVESTLHIRAPQEKDILDIVKSLRETGPGIDKIRPGDIKKNINTLLPTITNLMRGIIKTGKVPNGLKVSSVTPVFKKGEVDNIGNYRPIGSMCFLEKIFEKFVENTTKKYIEQHSIIPQLQYGFQPKKSTMTLLQDFAELVNKALDQRKYVVIIWLDLSKAYETIDHSTLLRKFDEIGIKNKIFTNFFENRKQVTKIGKTISDPENIEDGLVQGGITSPTWFNIYTYDVKYLNITGNLKMFADDSCLVSIHTNLEQAVKNAQLDFINLQKYYYNNYIYINESKTEAMVMGTAKGISEINNHQIICHTRECLHLETYKTSCFCPFIHYTNNCKYLGVNIDNCFKMKEHVNILNKKMRILNYQLKKNNIKTIPISSKKIIYHALIESILRYGVTLYTYAPEYVLEPLNSVQRKIIRYLFDDKDMKLMKIRDIATFIMVTQHFKNPKYRKKTETQYQLRRQDFEKPRVFTKYGERCLSYHIPKLLQEYCEDFLDEENVNKIKQKVKERILEKNKEE